MKKGFYLILVIVSIFALASCASTKANISTVSVTASAEIRLQPDVARFSVSAESVESTTDEARAKTSQMVNQAVEILISRFGVDKSDIKTDFINVSPYYVWSDNQRVLSGQRASQSIEVTLKNIDSYGEIFEALAKIDGISVSNANFDKLDKSKDIENVRALAIKAAYEKASTYASASGMNIETVLSIADSTSPSYSSNGLLMAKASLYDAETSTEYYVGDIALSDSVTVVYKLSK